PPAPIPRKEGGAFFGVVLVTRSVAAIHGVPDQPCPRPLSISGKGAGGYVDAPGCGERSGTGTVDPMTNSRPAVTLVHTSDVHIGPDSGPNRGRNAFCAVLDLVGRVRPDLFLIAGDLFDRNRVPEEDLRFVEGSLGALALPVLLVSGNHDSLDAG